MKARDAYSQDCASTRPWSSPVDEVRELHCPARRGEVIAAERCVQSLDCQLAGVSCLSREDAQEAVRIARAAIDLKARGARHLKERLRCVYCGEEFVVKPLRGEGRKPQECCSIPCARALRAESLP